MIGHREGFWQPTNQRDFMYFDEVLWEKKRRIQKERWYQMERNKENSVLKRESKSLSRILGEMEQELDVLMASVNAQQASEREEKIRCNDDIRNRTATTFIQSWRRLLARKELQRLQKEAKELSRYPNPLYDQFAAELNLKLKSQANDIKINPNLICGAISHKIDRIWSFNG